MLRRGSLNLNVEIAENFAPIGFQAEVGFQIGGKGDVNVAVQRAEGHRLLIDAIERNQNAPVQGMRDGAAGDVVQSNGAVHVVDVQLAVHACDHNVSGIYSAQLERSVNGNRNSEVDGAHVGIGGDAHLVVFLFDGKPSGRNNDALHAGIGVA